MNPGMVAGYYEHHIQGMAIGAGILELDAHLQGYLVVSGAPRPVILFSGICSHSPPGGRM